MGKSIPIAAPLRQLLRQSTDWMVIRGQLDNRNEAVIYLRKPSRPGNRGAGFCGAGHEGYFVLLERNAHGLRLAQKLRVDSCLDSITFSSSEGPKKSITRTYGLPVLATLRLLTPKGRGASMKEADGALVLDYTHGSLQLDPAASAKDESRLRKEIARSWCQPADYGDVLQEFELAPDGSMYTWLHSRPGANGTWTLHGNHLTTRLLGIQDTFRIWAVHPDQLVLDDATYVTGHGTIKCDVDDMNELLDRLDNQAR